MLAIDQLNTLSETGRDGVCQIARIALEGQEKMVGLGIDAVEEFVAEWGQAVVQACTPLTDTEPFGIAPALLARSARCGEALAGAAWHLAQQLQGELVVSGQAEMQALAAAVLEECGRFGALYQQLGGAFADAAGESGRRVRLAA